MQKESSFLIPILTPCFFKRPVCRDELDKFLKREAELKRNDMVFPIYWVSCPELNDEPDGSKDELAKKIRQRQWADWRELRFEPFSSGPFRKANARVAWQIARAIERVAKTKAAPAPSGGRKQLKKSGRSARARRAPAKIFISFSGKDRQWAQRLSEMINTMAPAGSVEVLWDNLLRPGDRWDTVLAQMRQAADIFVPLVSPNYLASEYALSVEFREAVERARSDSIRIIPVLLQSSPWHETELSMFHALPSEARPIANWPDAVAGLKDAADGIVKAAASLNAPDTAP